MRYRPSELRSFLDRLGRLPRKSLSQNFLIDGNIIQKIVSLAEVKKGDSILEIGPGPGALTEALVAQQAVVTAVEMDPVFAEELKALSSLTVLCQDFLKVELEDIFSKAKKWKVVANLPYHITTPILSKLLPHTSHLETITVMVQKEVADRFLAQPGSKEWNSFSLFIRFYATPSYGFTVEPTCFFPRPKVKSAVVQFKLHAPPLVASPERFFTLTRTAFQHRRKMLKSSLKSLYPHIEVALEKGGFRSDSRPEALSLMDFVRLFEEVDKHHSDIES